MLFLLSKISAHYNNRENAWPANVVQDKVLSQLFDSRSDRRRTLDLVSDQFTI